jgi:hypothetical protein
MDNDWISKALGNSAELRQRIIRDLGTYTVAMFARSPGKLELAGTGTLIHLCGTRYILTAAHVWEEKLKNSAQVGIAIAEDIKNQYAVATASFVVSSVLKPPKLAGNGTNWNEWGPDLILLRVPDSAIGSIQARRDFYDATVDGTVSPDPTRLRFHVPMGTPAALGTFGDDGANVLIVGYLVEKNLVYEERAGHDFYKIGMNTSTGFPKKLGGFSGGGLWLLEVYAIGEEIHWTRNLEGATFYQLPSIGDLAVARCHGPKSIGELFRQRSETAPRK